MSQLRVVPIVEGHGEQACVRTLIERVWREICGGEFVEVLRPVRQSRYRLVKPEHLAKAVQLAALKLLREGCLSDPGLILILLDADDDPACVLGPTLLEMARAAQANVDIACVLAVVEYETWFVAAAESLERYVHLGEQAQIPPSPEVTRLGKGWIKKRFRGVRYSETQDQPSLTQAMDLTLCRQRAPSFDKLCREFELRRMEFRPSTEPTRS